MFVVQILDSVLVYFLKRFNSLEVSMAWIVLIIAGLLETAWAATMKLGAEKFSFSLLTITLVLMLTSLAALYWSMRFLPLGIAYPVWTGIGSVGSVIVSVILFKQHIGLVGIAGLILLVIGMALISFETH